MALGSIVIDLLIKTGSFETDSKKAERRLKEMEKTAKRVGAAIGTAIVGGVTAATYAIRNQITAMDDLSKAALRAHMPTEEFSQLAYAGSLADVEMGNLVTSMGRLARAQADAQRGLATQTDAFRKLGIEFEDANGKMRSGVDVLKDFADVVQSRQGDPEVLAAGMQIFGRSFQNLIPLLSQGRAGLEAAADEADRLGITLDTQAGQQAEAFNDNLTRLKTAVDGVWRAVAADLLPDLLRLTEQFVATTKEGDRLNKTASNIADTIRLIGNVARYTFTPLLRLREVMQGIIGQAGATGEVMRGLIAFDAEQIAAGVAAYRAASDEIGHAFRSMSPGPSFGGVTGGVSSTAQTAEDAAAEAAAKLEEARRRAAEAAAASAKQRAEAERELAEAIRASEEAERALTQAMMDGEQRKIDWLNRIDDMEARAAGPAAMAVLGFRRELAKLNAALAVGDVEMHDYQRAAQALGQTLGEVTAEVDTATGEMTVFAEQAARNMQDAFADFLFDPFDGGIKGMVSSFAEALRKMVAQAAASEIFKAIGNWAGGTGTGWGAALSAILKGTRANGGNVASGGTYLVGERGPEILRMGPNSGTIVPNHAIGGGTAQGVKVEIINNTGAEVRTESGRAPDGAVLERIIIGTVGKGLARGDFDGPMGGIYGMQRKGVGLG